MSLENENKDFYFVSKNDRQQNKKFVRCFFPINDAEHSW